MRVFERILLAHRGSTIYKWSLHILVHFDGRWRIGTLWAMLGIRRLAFESSQPCLVPRDDSPHARRRESHDSRQRQPSVGGPNISTTTGKAEDGSKPVIADRTVIAYNEGPRKFSPHAFPCLTATRARPLCRFLTTRASRWVVHS